MSFFNAEVTPFRSKILTFIKFTFFLGLGIVFIWLSLKDLSQEEKSEIIRSFKIANYNWVVLVLIIGIFSHLLRSLRWLIFLEPMGYRISLKNSFYAVMIGYFANMAFPRLGEFTRCGVIAKYEKVPFTKALGTVITERALDMVIFFLLVLLTIFTQIGTISNYLQTNVYPKVQGKFPAFLSDKTFLLSLVLFVILLILSFIFLRKKVAHFKFYQRVKHLVINFWEGLKSLSQIRQPFLFIVYTLGIWLCYFLMLYLCFFCFPETSLLTPGAGLSALVLGSIGIMITPGGIGLYPAIIQETLLLYGIAKTTGLALGWIAWTAQTVMIIVVGCTVLLLLSFNKNINGKA
jgi:glycosyltransferase 2 family protein